MRGKLHLIDLAGSERIGRTGAQVRGASGGHGEQLVAQGRLVKKQSVMCMAADHFADHFCAVVIKSATCGPPYYMTLSRGAQVFI